MLCVHILYRHLIDHYLLLLLLLPDLLSYFSCNSGTIQIMKVLTPMLSRRWSQFVDCVKRYTDRCFTESHRQEFNKAVESPVDSVHQMCTVTKYQTGEHCKPFFQTS